MNVEVPSEQQEKKRKLEVGAEPRSESEAPSVVVVAVVVESNEVTISVYEYIKLQNHNLRYAEKCIEQARQLIKGKDENNDSDSVCFNVSHHLEYVMKEHITQAKYDLERFLKDKPNARQTYFPAMGNFDRIIQACIGERLEWPEEKKQ